jgi:hypothetical protein
MMGARPRHASHCRWLMYALDQLAGVLERLVKAAARYELCDGVAAVRHLLGRFVKHAETGGPISLRIVLQVHRLDAEIEPLRRRVDGLSGDRIFLAQDRASPSTRKQVRLAEFMITLSPMTLRSNGFSSTLSGIVVAPLSETAGP